MNKTNELEYTVGIEKALNVLGNTEVLEIRGLSEDELDDLRNHYDNKDDSDFYYSCKGQGIIEGDETTYCLHIIKRRKHTE